mgnify:CR=1 FL=1
MAVILSLTSASLVEPSKDDCQQRCFLLILRQLELHVFECWL